MDNTGDLRVLLASRHPLLLAEVRDEQRFMDLLRREAAALDLPVWTWSVTRGLARDDHPAQYGTGDPRRALEFVGSVGAPGVFVFADAHHVLSDPTVVRLVKESSQADVPGRTLVLTAPDHRLPAELEGLALIWSHRPPGRDELERLVRRTLDDLVARSVPVALGAGGIGRLVDALRGLSTGQAERLVQQAAVRDGSIGPEDIPYILTSKVGLFDPDGLLELIEAETGTLEDVGGMEGLKAWLGTRGRAWREGEAERYGLQPPRGILLTGIPGCGKSLVAKTLARTWDLPLLLLDPSRLYGRYVGESEQRLDRTMKAADAMAPAVLWVDEIEKGFASSGEADGGVSRRLLGTFLRWMQERPGGTFLVATANDVSALPPEFLRKGRFDEVFFVDLPGPAARAEILRLHLERRDRDPDRFDLDALVEASEGFSGAEIEGAVVGALYRALAGATDLTDAELLAEARATVPLSRARAEEVTALRAWARRRAVIA